MFQGTDDINTSLFLKEDYSLEGMKKDMIKHHALQIKWSPSETGWIQEALLEKKITLRLRLETMKEEST